jgi:hypothetical protein
MAAVASDVEHTFLDVQNGVSDGSIATSPISITNGIALDMASRLNNDEEQEKFKAEHEQKREKDTFLEMGSAEIKQREEYDKNFYFKCIQLSVVVNKNGELIKREINRTLRNIIDKETKGIYLISEVMKLFNTLAVYSALGINSARIYRKNKPKKYGFDAKELDKAFVEGLRETPGFHELFDAMQTDFESICEEMPLDVLTKVIGRGCDPFVDRVRESSFFIKVNPETTFPKEAELERKFSEESSAIAARNMLSAFDLLTIIPRKVGQAFGLQIESKNKKIIVEHVGQLDALFVDFFWQCMMGELSANPLADDARSTTGMAGEFENSEKHFADDPEIVGEASVNLPIWAGARVQDRSPPSSPVSPTIALDVLIDNANVIIKIPHLGYRVREKTACLRRYEWEVGATFITGSPLLWAINDSMAIRNSIVSFLRLYPEAFDETVPHLFWVEMFAMVMGTVMASHAIKYPDRPIDPIVKLWKALNESLAVFVFCLGSSIELFLMLNPTDREISNNKFWSEVAPFALISFLLHIFNSLYLRTKESCGSKAVNWYAATLFNSRIIERVVATILKLSNVKTRDERYVLSLNIGAILPGILITALQNSPYKQRVSMLMSLLTGFVFTPLLVNLLRNHNPDAKESTLNMVARDTLWTVSLLYSLGFSLKYGREYLRDYASPEALAFTDRLARLENLNLDNQQSASKRITKPNLGNSTDFSSSPTMLHAQPLAAAKKKTAEERATDIRRDDAREILLNQKVPWWKRCFKR